MSPDGRHGEVSRTGLLRVVAILSAAVVLLAILSGINYVTSLSPGPRAPVQITGVEVIGRPSPNSSTGTSCGLVWNGTPLGLSEGELFLTEADAMNCTWVNASLMTLGFVLESQSTSGPVKLSNGQMDQTLWLAVRAPAQSYAGTMTVFAVLNWLPIA